MRQIYCADKECELLPPNQTGDGSLGEHIITGSTGGLIPEAQETSIPLEPVKKPRKKKTKAQRGGARRTVKRLKKVQVGGGRRKNQPIKKKKKPARK